MRERTYAKHSSEVDASLIIETENETLEKELRKFTGIRKEKVTSSILNSLIKASNKSGVDFISVDPLDVRDKNGFKYIKLQVMCKSGFHEMGSFLSEIRKLNGLFFVDDIEMRCEDLTSNEITSVIEMSVYVLN